MHVLDSSTNAPLVFTQVDGSTATQVDGSTATQANGVGATATQEVVAATQAEATNGELPSVPPRKMSKIGTENEFMHVRCCAHILNLIVGEGLKEINASAARVREAVRYVKFLPNRNQTFRNFMERLGMESKCLLCLDVPTRWNLTYFTLEIAEKFEKVFLRMEFEDDGYSSYFRTNENSGGLGSPCMSDFQNCRAFVTFLRLFYNATKKFSGSLYVTSNAFFDGIFVIQESISHFVKSQNTLLKNTTTNMQTKFEKY
ncbi:hypothetical protein SO802_014914 [Lithocarpus litseifolius]|uniref:hAT-like transposase RNase-H fold domain-containing protein n=1 Tax=Lithocarpus litseifolius TaxID=425828 RepID=A0AAW2CUN7_9ROSI